MEKARKEVTDNTLKSFSIDGGKKKKKISRKWREMYDQGKSFVFGCDITICLYAGKNNPIEEKIWSCRREKNTSKENSLNGLETIVSCKLRIWPELAVHTFHSRKVKLLDL